MKAQLRLQIQLACILALQIEIINVNELPVITGDNAASVDENTTDIDARTGCRRRSRYVRCTELQRNRR